MLKVTGSVAVTPFCFHEFSSKLRCLHFFPSFHATLTFSHLFTLSSLFLIFSLCPHFFLSFHVILTFFLSPQSYCYNFALSYCFWIFTYLIDYVRRSYPFIISWRFDFELFDIIRLHPDKSLDGCWGTQRREVVWTFYAWYFHYCKKAIYASNAAQLAVIVYAMWYPFLVKPWKKKVKVSLTTVFRWTWYHGIRLLWWPRVFVPTFR